MGGAVGFLKMLRRIVEQLSPRAVYVVWEAGGSSRRRALYKDYKKGSRPAKLNRFYEDDIPESARNKAEQTKALLEFLRSVPVCQLYTPDCEADDVIAYLCGHRFKDHEKIIVSSDKDMHQLLNENTRQYCLHKKAVLSMEDVYTNYHITPWNFAIAKSLCGDNSDNIPGVPGMGFKTAVKRIPMLATHDDILLQDVFDYCNSHMDEHAVLKRVIESQNLVKTNWRLVRLDSSSLTQSQAKQIDQEIESFQPVADKVGLTRSLVKEGIAEFDVDSFLFSFMCIEGFSFKTGR